MSERPRVIWGELSPQEETRREARHQFLKEIAKQEERHREQNLTYLEEALRWHGLESGRPSGEGEGA